MFRKPKGSVRFAVLWTVLTLLAHGQQLEPTGVRGFDVFYATSPAGTSQLYGVALAASATPIPIGASFNNVPSRWAHRRRTLGALETQIAYAPSAICTFTPMGNALGNGGLHVFDARTGTAFTVAGGNPPGYDAAVVDSLQFVFTAEDNGSGGTTVRGWSYATPGQLLPLAPGSVTLAGIPAAHVNRIGVDVSAAQLHVATETGIHVIQLAAAPPQMTVATFIGTTGTATTNPASFMRGGVRTWIVGTSTFTAAGVTVAAGYQAWTAAGPVGNGTFGTIPILTPPRSYVPATGCEELAVSSNGTDSYVYYLLRDPSLSAFFIRPAAVGVIRFLGNALPSIVNLPCGNLCGEPFGIPEIRGHRIAFESSMGPPFISTPPDGSERINIIYSPLDPLGAGTPAGILVTPGPLGGRVSTRGMDRPLWTPDGTRVIAATSHFGGVGNPGVPGIEVLDVPAGVLLNEFDSPHTVVANPVAPNQSIILPSVWKPREAAPAAFLGSLAFAGNVFPFGAASILVAPLGELGQVTPAPTPYQQSVFVPDFPALLPATFHDAGGSAVAIPPSFGARRTTFNLVPGFGLSGVVMTAAVGNRIVIQPTGFNVTSLTGLTPAAGALTLLLPTGWTTTSEFLSV